MQQNQFMSIMGIVLTAIIFFTIHIQDPSLVQAQDEDEIQLIAQNKETTDRFDEQTIKESDTLLTPFNWDNVEEAANEMVEDSNGEFKKSWAVYLINEANAYDIDPFLVYELLKVETGHTFNPDLVGPETQYGHAYGLAQFMTNTAPWIADMANLPYSFELLFDPYYSMELSVVYLDYLYDEYNNWDEALTAYHRGMSGMETYKSQNGTARSEYAEVIQTNAEEHYVATSD
ncbi:Transglycosylase SLT domain-containing protein [Pelagirhabdus alkalitolerans]|uniref:Transglycosylase SLT domain-containing protein n=1 Tax=Pelagirhabdus alkalitolerans TaxID=1612202 RepID=A0A1G6HX43_9BACI|nr:transglycosylase SLT domain-containing protein [Pelagirhabdus alkalitolerans]SDB98879.1 Transglycosylase SLT domain-containing protein [Pelagirhabdus alkalitolerans]